MTNYKGFNISPVWIEGPQETEKMVFYVTGTDGKRATEQPSFTSEAEAVAAINSLKENDHGKA